MRVLIQGGDSASNGWAVGERVSLGEQEAHHLRVRRAKQHDRVQVLDGAGLLGTGSLVRAGRTWMVHIDTVEFTERPAPFTLAVAAGDRERFSWVVEKSVELGVTRIVPLESARTAGVSTRLKSVHVARLRRAALEAMKQCGVTWAPHIEDPVPLSSFLGHSLTGAGWLADQHGDPTPPQLDESPLTVIVGPEGGLTDDEREQAVAAGYRPMALGLHTLRFETAALAAGAVVAQARMRGRYG